MADDDQWWYNTTTGEVEHGAQSPWSDRAGPYRTREEAEGAPARIAANSRRMAAEDD
ncbi:MAG: SPOR domain-containing protein [Acidobacteria bacterium]|nr:SPOR domain-containing protein [Acidobacteriota bacterium]